MNHDPASDIQDELQFHYDELVEHLESQGLSRDEAEQDQDPCRPHAAV